MLINGFPSVLRSNENRHLHKIKNDKGTSQGNCSSFLLPREAKEAGLVKELVLDDDVQTNQLDKASYPQQPPAPRDHGRRRQQHRPRVVMVRGEPLLELISLSANFPVMGSITAFDVKHGQIIYENDGDHGQGDAHPPTCTNNAEGGFTNLILTGPYTAISPEGESFAIKLNPAAGPNDDESDGAGQLWECNICEADDGIVESVISTDKGKIIVTYAVLSNAAEATVRVNLVGFAADAQVTQVYGKITAHIPDFDDEDTILLFSRPARQALQLTRSSAAPFNLLPLSRSVIVVPVGSCIDVAVEIYATSVHQDTPPVRFQDNLCFAFGEDSTLRIPTAMGDLAVSVNITH